MWISCICFESCGKRTLPLHGSSRYREMWKTRTLHMHGSLIYLVSSLQHCSVDSNYATKEAPGWRYVTTTWGRRWDQVKRRRGHGTRRCRRASQRCSGAPRPALLTGPPRAPQKTNRRPTPVRAMSRICSLIDVGVGGGRDKDSQREADCSLACCGRSQKMTIYEQNICNKYVYKTWNFGCFPCYLPIAYERICTYEH
jgi:hypothetical protein